MPSTRANVTASFGSTPSANNPVINSAFQVWQRGTSAAGSSTGFSADRWQSYRGASGSTFSRQVTNDTTNLPNIQYCARVQRDSGNTGTGLILIGQNIETLNSVPFAGKTVTLSFYARSGANFSSASSALAAQLYSGTGTDQNAISGSFTGSAVPINGTATLTTTWQRFTYTGTIATNATELSLQFYYTPVGTAGANDWFEITGVQVDIGSVALPFRTCAGTLQGELAACQRYYWRTNTTGAGQFSPQGLGIAASTTQGQIIIKHPVTMRTAPTSVDWANLMLNDASGSTGISTTTIGTDRSNAEATILYCNVSSGLTQFRPYFLLNNANTAAYVGFSAEL